MQYSRRRATYATVVSLWLFACASGNADSTSGVPLGGTGNVGSSALCTTGLTLCGEQCVNLLSSATNCGVCNNGCPANTVCSSGVCQASCSSEQTLCAQSCTDLASDANNCGLCGTVCPTGYACVNHLCAAAVPSGAGGATGAGSASSVGGTSSKATVNAGGTGGKTTTGAGGTKAATTTAVTCNANVTSTGCTVGTLGSSGTLTGPYGTAKATASGKEYFIQVNEWGSTASQTLTYGNPFMKMTTQNASTATSGAPAGYPSLFIGSNSGNSTANSGMPKAVSSLGSVLTTWNWSDGGTISDTTNNKFNVAYDVWFSTGSGGDAGSVPSGGYLMVWLHAQGCQPVGSIKVAGKTIDGVPGCWNVWVGTNNNKPVISYQHQGAIKSLGFDLNLFIKDAYTNFNSSYKNWYLTNIFAGFEIWKGGVGLQTTSFCADVK